MGSGKLQNVEWVSWTNLCSTEELSMIHQCTQTNDPSTPDSGSGGSTENPVIWCLWKSNTWSHTWTLLGFPKSCLRNLATFLLAELGMSTVNLPSLFWLNKMGKVQLNLWARAWVIGGCWSMSIWACVCIERRFLQFNTANATFNRCYLIYILTLMLISCKYVRCFPYVVQKRW